MRKIVAELKSRDKRLGAIIDAYPLCTIGSPHKKSSNFEALVETVISQQLAVKAADTIYARLKELASGTVTQSSIGKISESQFRAAGVSGAKTKTIMGLTHSDINFAHLNKKSDEDIRQTLTALWGIGTWTVDMYMIFQLGRLDI